MSQQEGILLDTHSLIWLVLKERPIAERALRQLESGRDAGLLYIASITLMEAANMYRRGKLSLPCPLQDWFEQTLAVTGIQVIPLTTEIATETIRLPEEFHGDPADRLIAATVRVENLTLCTHDKDLIRYGKQGLYRLLAI